MSKPTKQGITSAQFRQAAKDLNLTVTTVAEKTGLSKAYVSEFRNETRNLSISQQSQLRTYIDGEYEAQGLDFPEDDGSDNAGDLGKELGKMVQQITRPAILISEDLPKGQVDDLIDLIDGNRIRAKKILEIELETGGFLSSGKYTEATDDSIREFFGLCTMNYLAILMLQGRNIVSKPADSSVELKTIGDLMNEHFANSELFPLMPAQQSDEVEA